MNLQRSIFFIVLVFIFCLISNHHLKNEFWVDEFYTLFNFVLVPIETTLYDYHVPNNHILFSLIIKVYILIIGFFDFKIVIENPVIARLPMLLLAIGVLYQYWKITSYFFKNINWRYVSVLLLCGNVVFGNFIFQYRGYGLSMLFLSFVFHFVLKAIFEKNKNVLNYIVIVLSAFGAFYTIPSNLYFILAIAISCLFFGYANKNKVISKEKFLGISSVLALGIILGLISYFPIFNAVFFNKDVTNVTPFAFINFYKIIKVLFDLSSYHVLLYVFGIYSFIVVLRSRRWNFSSLFYIPLIVCILPFIFSFLHGDEPPVRVYSVILPFYTILLTWSLMKLSQQFNIEQTKNLFTIIPIYILVHFVSVELYINHKTKSLNQEGRGKHGLIFQYHNYQFNPLMLLDILSKNNDLKPVYYFEFIDGLEMLIDRYGYDIQKREISDIQDSEFLLIINDPRVVNKQTDVFEINNLMPDSKYFKVYEMRKK